MAGCARARRRLTARPIPPARYRAHAAGYDASARRTLPLRVRNVANLGLAPGDAVLDVACGTGLSFPLLVDAVGERERGRVVGVELSPDMASRACAHRGGGVAQRRAGGGRAMEAAPLVAHSPFNAVHCNFTHDVLQSEAALANLFAACKPGTRVAVAGSKLLPWRLAPLNLYVRWNNAPYMTPQKNLRAPWTLLERYVPDLARVSVMFGACYLAEGTYGGVGT